MQVKPPKEAVTEAPDADDGEPPVKKKKVGRPIGAKKLDYEKILPKRETREKRKAREKVPANFASMVSDIGWVYSCKNLL